MRLGVTEDEFFAMTPRYFVALRRAWEQREWEKQRNIALLRVDLINGGMTRPKEPVKLEDVLAPAPNTRGIGGSHVAVRSRGRLTRWHREEIAKGWRSFMGSGLAGYTTVEVAEPPPKL
jgi:hypothetical protein